MAILVVATKIFPGETGGGQILGVLVCRRGTPVDAKHGAFSQWRVAQGRPELEACWISGGDCSCTKSISGAGNSINYLVIFILTVLTLIREPGAARRAAAVSRHGRAADPLNRIGGKSGNLKA
ncbi:hypothetical protein [Haematobacter missouriensis]|uniref:hypothetical protein n=1 Tax=Haematobacter missouriensis TaxID=366616 RepID=UPI0012EC9D45|nr:hypothetical protein [Haematobacter missouriensis]